MLHAGSTVNVGAGGAPHASRAVGGLQRCQNSFRHRAELGKLLGAQCAAQVPGDDGRFNFPAPSRCLAAGIRESNGRTPVVLEAGAASNQSASLHAAKLVREPALLPIQPASQGDVTHTVAGVLRKSGQDLEVGLGEPCSFGQLTVESLGQAHLHTAIAAPGGHASCRKSCVRDGHGHHLS
jgi:hypothetical protein